jgi:ribosomal protein L37E
MTATSEKRPKHKHREVTVHVLVQRAGVPYELEKRVCETCGHELERRSIRRAAA